MICIVGAGLTGLALAHELAGRGIEHVVFEAADRPGGVIRSARVAGRVLDFGPQRLRMSGPLAALVEQLGLEAEVVRAPTGLPLYVYSRGALRRVPTSLGALLRGDLLSCRGKLRVAWEPLTGAARPDESVSRCFTRKLGREAYERLAGPLYGGLYGTDPADMVVGMSLAGLLKDLGVRRSFLARFVRQRGSAAGAPFTFRDGVGALPMAIHAANARSVRLGSPVRRIRGRSGGWVVESEGEAVEGSAVVLACDAREAGRLLDPIAPEAAERLRRLVYNALAIVHMDAEDTPLSGMGYQVALGEGLATRGVTWNGSLFGADEGRRGLHTAFLGGAAARAVVTEPDDRLGATAVREFALVTGRKARVLAVSRTSMPAWDASWKALAGLRLPPGIYACGSWMSRPGVPGRLAEARRLASALSGPGLSAVVSSTTVDGT